MRRRSKPMILTSSPLGLLFNETVGTKNLFRFSEEVSGGTRDETTVLALMQLFHKLGGLSGTR